jgi:chloramphenicol-sensitive protein RarD
MSSSTPLFPRTDLHSQQSRTRGIWQGVAAYSIWGHFPIYWTLFHGIPALEVLAHRMVWSFVALIVLITLMQRQKTRRLLATRPTVIALYALAAVLIGINWYLYVWAVNAGFVVETSLGYFITPLVSVVLGVAVFRERLSAAQWIAVAIAATGVLYLTAVYGAVPWVAVGLAATFGSYGLVKKRAPLPPLEGLTLETAILLAPAVAYLVFVHVKGIDAFPRAATATELLLAASGIITVVPLLLFAGSVRAVPLSIVGILQYISPSIQLVLGVWIFREPFTRAQLVGFASVWAALVIFAADGLRGVKRPRP